MNTKSVLPLVFTSLPFHSTTLMSSFIHSGFVMKSSLSILNELERLRNAHQASRANHTGHLQPTEKEQQVLIAKSCAAKLVASEIRKETQKFIYSETMKIHQLKRSLEDTSSQENNSQNNYVPSSAQGSRPVTSLARVGTSHHASFHDYVQSGSNRPSTAGFATLLKDTSAPNEAFDDNINHQIKQQVKNAKNVFNALVSNFKQGTLVQFTAKSTAEQVDVTQFVPPPVVSALQTSIRLEDLKKKDGMALIMDPSVNTYGHKVTLRFRFKKQVSFNTEEDCVKDYSFHGNGNYFGVDLCDELAYRESFSRSQATTASGGMRNSAEFSMGRQSSNRSIGSEEDEHGSPVEQLVDPSTMWEDKISLPGWGFRPPIFILATVCTVELLLQDDAAALDPALMFELSKLRLYAITSLTLRSGMKKFSDFCDVHFQTATANLLIPGGVSALNIAALHGNLEAVAQLIANGANVNLRNKGSRYNTALHEAVIGGFKEVAQFLLENGANQLLKDDAGNTPLHLACKLNDIGIARVLINSTNGKRALISLDNNDQKPIDACATNFMKIRIEGAMRKMKIFVKPRVSILDR